VLSLLTLAEYVFSEPRVHTLLLSLLPTDTLRLSARIAPNTAVCFVLASAALLVMTHSRQSRHMLLMAELLGVVVLALGAVAGLGYLVHLPTAYQWGYATGWPCILRQGLRRWDWDHPMPAASITKGIGTFRWVPGVVGVGVTVIILYSAGLMCMNTR
jgi:hypothetical protein